MTARAQAGSLTNVKILVAEDNDDTRELLQVFFEAQGAEVLAHASGVEAWEAFLPFRPHVVLSDLSMPGIDGYEFVRRIRALDADHGGRTPAIALSAAGVPERSIEAGFHVHCTKPFDPHKLAGIVRGFVEKTPIEPPVWTLLDLTSEMLALTLVGFATAADIGAAMNEIAERVRAGEGHHVVIDLRKLTGFDPASSTTTEEALRDVRDKIIDVTVIGGPRLARLVTRATCALLRIPCRLSTDPVSSRP